MSERETGGPAFPCGEQYQTTDLVGNVHKHSKGPLKSGMALRDYFAAKALPAILEQKDVHSGRDIENAAWIAYQMADAMLQARQA